MLSSSTSEEGQRLDVGPLLKTVFASAAAYVGGLVTYVLRRRRPFHMRSITELIGFCKRQSAYHRKKAAEPDIRTEWAARHSDTAQSLDEIAEYLSSAPAGGSTATGDPSQGDLFALDPFNLDDIPGELLDELKISKADKVDAQIVELLKIAGRPLTISEVLVGLFRKFGDQHKRTGLSARLYRMAQAKTLVQIEGERGTYGLP
jgi:hypothetical protein